MGGPGGVGVRAHGAQDPHFGERPIVLCGMCARECTVFVHFCTVIPPPPPTFPKILSSPLLFYSIRDYISKTVCINRVGSEGFHR